ncbi:hypothetical protein [Fulvivirga ligni]|uniref:hypothetical protein n=1 Tax=Fulvivirga ligni TaxID=2904246 RepID=UPI001F40F2A5|nr:hypothetical protein [Fulvivirga ligni]UII20600.1 hypothetical protein LVD16_22420 [Fulvivirga ligni]
MKARETYLKGKSVFIISVLVIAVTVITIYATGINYSRSLTNNFYISLAIIGFSLFLFMTYGLYKGLKLVNDMPEINSYEMGSIITGAGSMPEFGEVDGDDNPFTNLLLSILWWIVMSIVMLILMLVFEFVLWISLILILAMLYWVFFRALKAVFSRSPQTRGSFSASAAYALGYTLMYTGWMFAVVFIFDIIR